MQDIHQQYPQNNDVLVIPADEVSYDDVVHVLERLKLARYPNVALGTRARAGPVSGGRGSLSHGAADQPSARCPRDAAREAISEVQDGGAQPRSARGYARVDRLLCARRPRRLESSRPVVAGVNLPEARVGTNALQQLTLGVGRQVTLAGAPVMNTAGRRAGGVQ